MVYDSYMKKEQKMEMMAMKATVEGSNSLSQKVYHQLLERFMTNELVPGNVLNRRKIAAELKVSVAPVLEALLQLEIEGFVESIPRKGTIVKPIRKEDVLNQHILREAIECQAARYYHGEPVRQHRNSLLALAEKVEATVSDVPEHWSQEIAFHRNLVELSGCSALLKEFVRITRLGSFYNLNRVLLPQDRQERLSHIELVDQLTTESADEAESIIRNHLRSGKHHLFIGK